jgi:hypothetical protein
VGKVSSSQLEHLRRLVKHVVKRGSTR